MRRGQSNSWASSFPSAYEALKQIKTVKEWDDKESFPSAYEALKQYNGGSRYDNTQSFPSAYEALKLTI